MYDETAVTLDSAVSHGNWMFVLGMLAGVLLCAACIFVVRAIQTAYWNHMDRINEIKNLDTF